ncbi:hypothetical protein BC937DRAFT_95618 [Endogone sp. FLAS-F59071]|nr:hypothetical protein BC937DRAFT_95618 [Endogone sp. FLAS-F59071]|eukprot:RUS20244.1 hypothetical protein BC937DRAFT_95618 [Endogone sp. FLAS-F59071]
MASEKKPPFNEAQIEVIKCIADTIISQLDDKATAELIASNAARVSAGNLSSSEIESYSKLSWSSMDLVSQLLERAPVQIPPNKLSDLNLCLTLLTTKLGTLVLTGHCNKFKNLTPAQREAVLLTWSTSSVALLRQIFKAFTSLTVWLAFVQDGSSLKRVLGYPGPDPEAHSDKFKPNSFPPYEFVRVPPEGLELECDVVVIGSGAGGGVAAAELAQAGKRVIVLEKSRFYRQEELTTEELSGWDMYEKKGPFTTDDASIYIVAGSTFGGGTTVNWSASLQPQHFVREQWAAQGLPYFMSPRFQRDLNRIYKRIGASKDAVVHNVPNQLLIDGCRALGYHVDTIPQNTAGHPHQCGWCCFGCRYGEKQSTVMTWLDDARKAGAQFVENCYVERVVVKDGVARGVEAVVGEGRLRVKADKVVLSAGSLNSPGVLMRSGLRNKHIGKNLWLHPCTIVFGVFPDRDVKAYEGSLMTAAKLEVPCLHPSSLASVMPWRGSQQFKDIMLKYNHISSLLILTRDKDSRGTVYYDGDGTCRVDYTVSPHDRRSLMEGLLRALDIIVAAGAEEIITLQNGVESFKWRKDEERSTAHERYRAWIENKVKKMGLANNLVGFFSAHQMGTCRMGSCPTTSVVNPHGETWEVKNLYVADASTFPTSTGVNPMVTTEAVALYVADEILAADNSKVDVMAKL